MCGDDPFTGQNCDHRKAWLEKRLLELSSIFSIELYTYAILSNHYHCVLYIDPLAPQKWTNEEVAEKWLLLYPSIKNDEQAQQRREDKKQTIIKDQKRLALYRERLGSLSWFMPRLNEPLAKNSNFEDEVNAVGRENALGYKVNAVGRESALGHNVKSRFWDCLIEIIQKFIIIYIIGVSCFLV